MKNSTKNKSKSPITNVKRNLPILSRNDALMNIHGETAHVVEMLSEDPDYWVRLRDKDGETFCVPVENDQGWRLIDEPANPPA